MTHKSVLAAAFAPAFLQTGQAAAQLPPGVYAGQQDYRLAPTGAYALDPAHTAVIAKVSHIGYSLSVFRFDRPFGTLTWDADHPDRSSLDVAVDVASISTPVPGFAVELSGDQYLKTTAFPKA